MKKLKSLVTTIKTKRSHRLAFGSSLTLVFLLLIYLFLPRPNVDSSYLQDPALKVSFNLPFTVHFTQSMDRQAVEEAFVIEPTLRGSFEWPDAKTLVFRPDELLEVGDTYSIQIGEGARNKFLKSLTSPVFLNYTVSGAPYVKFVSPYLGDLPTPEDELATRLVESPTGEMVEVQIQEEDYAEPVSDGPLVIPTDQVITVMFDRPIRPLSDIATKDAQDAFPTLEITPALSGDYRPIGSRAFQFIPDEPWALGTVYHLKLPAGIQTLDGAETEESVEWELVTESLRVVDSSPFEGDDVVGVEQPIHLYFNQEVDLDDIRPGDNLLMFPTNDLDVSGGLRQDGFFNGEVSYGVDEDGKKDRTQLVLKPTFAYQYNQDYQLVLKEGLKSGVSARGEGYGGRFMPTDFVLNFLTLQKPDIDYYLPRNGNREFSHDAVSIDFTSPIEKEEILKHISIRPEFEEEPELYLSNRGRHAELVYSFEPSTEYTFIFEGPYTDAAGNRSESGFRTKFKTAPKNPYLTVLTSGRTGFFMEGLDPVYPIRTTNIDSVDLEFCRVSESEYFATSSSYSWADFSCSAPFKETVLINGKLNQSHFTELNLQELFDVKFKEGIYFVRMSSPDYLDYRGNRRRFHYPFFISDTALALKRSNQDLLVWATDLKTGDPVGRMEIEVMDEKGSVIQRGVTDGDGVYKISKDLYKTVMVLARKNLEGEDRWSMVHQGWGSGIESWRFNTFGDWIGQNEPRIYLYTERPLYRPGDDLYFKGIYRMDQDAKLSFPEDKQVRVVLEDSEYNEVQSIDIALQPDGSFDGQFLLGSKARLGRYNIYAETIDQEGSQRFYHHFFVEEFKKPNFKVELITDQVDLVKGDPIKLNLHANYFFGGAIREGKVNWTLMAEPTVFNDFESDDYYSFGSWRDFYCFWSECTGDSAIVDEGESELSEDGHLELLLRTDHKSEPGMGYLYTLSVEVENQDGQFVSSRKTFVVHPATYYIGLNVKNFIVKPLEELSLKVVSVSSEGELVSGKKVDVELYREEWNTVKKEGVDGAFYEESVRELKFVKDKTVTTTDEPLTVDFKIDRSMEAGRYIIQAKAKEGRNELLTESSFYVTSSSFVNWGASNNNRIDLRPDKPEYFVGGKARVLIKSPYGTEDNPAKALVTYERGTVQRYEVIDVHSNTETIEIPIRPEMVPNVYVSVMVMKDSGEELDRFVAGQRVKAAKKRQLEIDDERKEITDEIEEIETDSEELEEGELDNRTTILVSKRERRLEELASEYDDLQKLIEEAPANSENVNFEFVKPDFKMGVTNLVVSKRDHEILIDLKPGREAYEVGDTVSVEIHTRDYQNRPIPAVVSLAVVDESLLALKANHKVSPLDYFYGQRALQVDTAQNLTKHIDRLSVESSKGAKGGDGGLAEGFDKKRGDFRDTAYFNPLIQTDAGGFAKVEFEPPDNLTSWQLWAVASSSTDQFGMAKEDFVVRKPVAITPILPRFVISGDELTVGALLHNQSGETIDTKVELVSEAFAIQGSDKKSVKLEDGESKRVDWKVEAHSVVEDSMATVQFRSPDDVLEIGLPVKPFSFPEVVALNGQVEDEALEAVLVPNTVTEDLGELELRAGGSLITSFIEQFEGLASYPYGCAEQVVSKILPLLTLQLKSAQVDLAELVGMDPEQNKKLIIDTLQKLNQFQRFDGGYGFWESSTRSYPFLTSYILYAQHLAKEAGFTVADNSMNLAASYLWKELNRINDDRYLNNNQRVFILWVLSEIGQNDTGMTVNLYEQRETLKLYSHALLLMNLKNLSDAGQKSVRPFMEKLKSEIVSRHLIQDRQVHFEEDHSSWWDLNTNRRTTALVMMALNRENPNNPLVPNIYNYLTNTAVERGLVNTQETAWILQSVLEYAHTHGGLNPDFEFEVEVNGSKKLSGEVEAQNLSEIFELTLPLSKLKQSPDMNEVHFEKEGKGLLNYDLKMTYYLPNEELMPLEKGIHITRDYYSFDEEEASIVDAMKSGEIYRGQLNLIVPEDMYYVVVEERLPAGLSGINFNLDTTDQTLLTKLEEQQREENPDVYWYNNPLWYFNHREVRDDRILLFADFLPKGVYQYDFLVRAGLPGFYHHLPASAYQMYFPEVFGRTGGKRLEVEL